MAKSPKKKAAPSIVLQATGSNPVVAPPPGTPVPRDPTYTEERAAALLDRIVEGEALNRICADPTMPSKGMVFRWMGAHPDFADQYASAVEMRLNHYEEDMITIADTPMEGVKTEISDQFGRKETRGDMIEHRKLMLDARKWLLGKLRRKKYGDAVDLNVGGQKDGAPIAVASILAVTTDPTEAAKLYQEAMRGVSRPVTAAQLQSDEKDDIVQEDSSLDEPLAE